MSTNQCQYSWLVMERIEGTRARNWAFHFWIVVEILFLHRDKRQLKSEFLFSSILRTYFFIKCFCVFSCTTKHFKSRSMKYRANTLAQVFIDNNFVPLEDLKGVSSFFWRMRYMCGASRISNSYIKKSKSKSRSMFPPLCIFWSGLFRRIHL